MKNLFSIVALFIVFSMTGQQSIAPGQLSGSIASGDNIFAKFDRINKTTNDETSGSRFVFSDFKQRGIVFTNGKAYTAYGINIDALNDDLISIVGVDSMLVYDKNKIDSIRINQRNFYKNENNIFHEVLYKGRDQSFIKKFRGLITDGYKNVMKGTEDKGSYKVVSEYYIKKDANYTSIKLKKKEILSVLASHKDEIVKFAKENKLSYKKESDLVKIFRYIDTL